MWKVVFICFSKKIVWTRSANVNWLQGNSFIFETIHGLSLKCTIVRHNSDTAQVVLDVFKRQVSISEKLFWATHIIKMWIQLCFCETKWNFEHNQIRKIRLKLLPALGNVKISKYYKTRTGNNSRQKGNSPLSRFGKELYL